MKVVVFSDIEFRVFLTKEELAKVDFNDKGQVEYYFKRVFLSLKNHYKMTMRGFYDVEFYVDPLNGGIIEAVKEEEEFFKIFEDKIDMKISCSLDSVFLYETNDYFVIDLLDQEDFDVYYFENNFYFKLKRDISEKMRMYLSEFTVLKYGDDLEEIMRLGKKL